MVSGYRSYGLILVEDHAVDEHVVTLGNVMHAHWGAHFDAGAHRGFVEFLTASGHVNDLFAEAIVSRAGTFLQHDCAARRHSVIVPLPSVVVVVVEVSVTWAHANGAATANAILSISFFIQY